MQPQTGTFLMAHPLLDDGNFARCVVLLTEHNDDGTVGLVLNRPSEYTLSQALVGSWPDWPLNLGGPVGTDSLFFLHLRPDLISGGNEVLPGVFFGGSLDDVQRAAESKALSAEDVLFAAGYSGWSVGQLQAELDEGSWVIQHSLVRADWWQQADLYQHWAKRWPEDLKLWLNSPEVPYWN
ncbi:MAG: hypothetical protein RIR07_762 [Bacteroidota bacterium]|jgi:putative transcriptional regulator